ncbi:Gfo/Idh/MocA family protein [Lihuaxuella thermophila]|uniref:Predicted dehydrogenase n=1 Tax=Lihuaxuella thermophila TaxID=1173111 RepID=A0A1H8FHC5_9BACL|nr:Gfo/Idh/MocA family oxidoreductase [Lihuaxuella thermophila]SEN31139.1 Predicted dehydrogenase [Lihuaxuella thermophila]
MLNIGFVGVGGIAQVHLRNIARMEGARVAAVYDINTERANEVARQYDCKAYSSLIDLLDGEKPDGVYICLPPFAHGETELEIVKRGIPMFIEKPLAAEREPADQILQAVEEKKLLTSVGYHWRYSDASDAAKAALAGRTPGMVMGYWLGDMPMVGWWRQMDKSGGQMVEQTTHIVDLARYLLGDVTEVYAVYGNRGMKEIVEGVTVPDVGSITLKFASGAVGTVSNSCLLDQYYTVGLNIVTRDLVLEVRRNSFTERRKGEARTVQNSSDPYYVEDEVFIEAIRTGDASKIRSDYADAYRTHLVTVAANESAVSGRPVQL